MSKGYKQRTGLAAALIHDPEVLILDEPTSGLDPNQIIEIREVIKKQGAEKTVLFSSHILQEVEAICERVVIISKGELVADDRLTNLRKKGETNQSVKVEFKENIGLDKLKQLGSVTDIKEGSSSSGNPVFSIGCNDSEALKKQLLQFSIDNNLNIISLQSINQSLETIFKELTSS